MTKVVRIAIRQLVEFLLREGDLDETRGGWAERDAMLAGARIHRKIQKSRGPLYQAEVPLSWEEPQGDILLCIEGRADGIYEQDGTVILEEIKGITTDVSRLKEPVPVHLAQARCYAYIHAREQQLDQIGIRMTYVQLETEQTESFFLTETMDALSVFFQELVDAYRPWASFLVAWEEKSRQSLRHLAFPFSYRPGQEKLITDIYRTILREKQVFVQAPTGVGKTISTLYPAVRAMGEGLTNACFYLTAKATTQAVAKETVQLLQKGGMACKTLVMTAKEKICLLREDDREMVCSPAECPYAKGHFDRINEVLYSFLTQEDLWDHPAIRQAAIEGRVCPYAMQNDLIRFADIWIGDYNYIFSPSARMHLLSGEGKPKRNMVFLIDEAHNLIDRGRDMFSADLYREELLSLRRMLRTSNLPLYKKTASACYACAKILLSYRKTAEETPLLSSVQDLYYPLLRVIDLLEEVLGSAEEEPLVTQARTFYFRARAFLTVMEQLDGHYLIYGKPLGKQDFYLKCFCVDPSDQIQQILDQGRSTVFFSATLVPIRYYKALLSGRTDDYAIAVPSPFPSGNRLLLIGTDVTTRYSRRTSAMYDTIAAYIALSTAERTGNYMVCFPSYEMLEQGIAAFRERIQSREEEVRLLAQAREMDEEARAQFLQAFAHPNEKTTIGFCVMGGVFAEGVDLYGDRLIGSIVVGTGIPQIGEERELLRSYYGADGFAYAYQNPGMNKVLQAAGRVIRSPQDVGWILLLDERFCDSAYRESFPPSWQDRKRVTKETIRQEIRAFWDRKSI